MSIITEKKEELKDVQTAKFITSMLRDISAIKMRNIKNRFKKNDIFFAEISKLYNLVKLQELKQAKKNNKKKEQRISATLFIAITSNKHFFGLLNSNVMERFLKEIEEKKGDNLIIGNTGKQYTSNLKYKKKFKYMSFEDDSPTDDELSVFLERIKHYSRVIIFYPSFVSVFKQGVKTIDITQKPELTEDLKKEEEYIFEPDLFEMIQFFEIQIRNLLFNRAMLETELARTAARLMKMNESENRATELIKEKEIQLQKETMALSSIRLLETFLGYKQWRKQ